MRERECVRDFSEIILISSVSILIWVLFMRERVCVRDFSEIILISRV